MWTVVYIAKNTQIAEQLRTLLEDGGMLVKIRPISKSEENADPSCEVLVPESEIEQGLMIESGFLRKLLFKSQGRNL